MLKIKTEQMQGIEKVLNSSPKSATDCLILKKLLNSIQF